MKKISFEVSDVTAIYIAEMLAYTKMTDIGSLLCYLGGYVQVHDKQFPKFSEVLRIVNESNQYGRDNPCPEDEIPYKERDE